MRKKIAAMLCSLAMMATCLCVPAFAETKPSLELMYFSGTSEIGTPVRGAETLVYYRNNTNKPIKYVEWYITAYNRVGDATPDFISGNTTKHLTTIGPIPPFELVRESENPIKTNLLMAKDSPFRYYKNTRYWIAAGDNLQAVYQDAYNNFFIQANSYDVGSCTYLTEDEIENALFSEWCQFNDTGWYNNLINRISLDGIVITYMDESTEVAKDVGSKYRMMSLQNPPFARQLAQYQAVYNYKDYLKYNPDIAQVYGENQKALFEHFVTSGMKEGRRASDEFDLNAYKANNPDLASALGNDNVKYYEHYISGGKAEGRIAV